MTRNSYLDESDTNDTYKFILTTIFLKNINKSTIVYVSVFSNMAAIISQLHIIAARLYLLNMELEQSSLRIIYVLS